MNDEVKAREVSPVEAKKLLDSGFSYVDVRSSLEFRSGHPTGAVNVPFLLQEDPSGAPNPDFVRLIAERFATDDPLLLGCASGVRSRAAAELLRQRGFANVVEMPAGFDGRRSAFGAIIERGWRASGLPVTESEG